MILFCLSNVLSQLKSIVEDISSERWPEMPHSHKTKKKSTVDPDLVLLIKQFYKYDYEFGWDGETYINRLNTV